MKKKITIDFHLKQKSTMIANRKKKRVHRKVQTLCQVVLKKHDFILYFFLTGIFAAALCSMCCTNWAALTRRPSRLLHTASQLQAALAAV
jgi:hypothetical protein